MEKLIKAAGVIVGILCAGFVSYLAYKQHKEKKVSTQKKQRLSGSKGSLNLARDRDERIGSVSDACLEIITKVEEKSFQEINDLFLLDRDTLQLMTNFLVENGILEKSSAFHISSFTDILIQLRHRKILGPTKYFDVLQRIFTEIGYDISNEKSLLADNTKALVTEVIGKVRGHHRDNRVDEDQKIDIIVLYSDNDHKDAKRMVDNIRQRVSVEDLQVELTDTVCPGGMLNISAFGKVLESCLYIFIMITPSFKEDELNRFLGETGLVSDLKSNENRWRFVPIWMTKEMSQLPDVPFEYSALKGMKYFRYLNDNSDIVCFQNITRLVNEGRKKEKRRAEMERRRNLQE